VKRLSRAEHSSSCAERMNKELEWMVVAALVMITDKKNMSG
jgi:hypothetical protein